jgi:hypothetical protein
MENRMVEKIAEIHEKYLNNSKNFLDRTPKA